MKQIEKLWRAINKHEYRLLVGQLGLKISRGEGQQIIAKAMHINITKKEAREAVVAGDQVTGPTIETMTR